MTEPQDSPWLPDVTPVTWTDYKCPACGGKERVSSLVDRPVMHRHRYGSGPLQTGVVLLREVTGTRP